MALPPSVHETYQTDSKHAEALTRAGGIDPGDQVAIEKFDEMLLATTPTCDHAFLFQTDEGVKGAQQLAKLTALG